MAQDLFQEIATLAERAATRYTTYAAHRTSPVSVDSCLTDPASRWVLSAAVAGRALPINAATARALEAAVAELAQLA
jgi:hypothetical protein